MKPECYFWREVRVHQPPGATVSRAGDPRAWDLCSHSARGFEEDGKKE